MNADIAKLTRSPLAEARTIMLQVRNELHRIGSSGVSSMHGELLALVDRLDDANRLQGEALVVGVAPQDGA